MYEQQTSNVSEVNKNGKIIKDGQTNIIKDVWQILRIITEFLYIFIYKIKPYHVN